MSSVALDNDSKLIESLIKLSKSNPKLVRSSVYEAPSDSNVKLRSWKMNEFKYYEVPSPFPTLARGLFSEEEVTEGQDHHRIVARGYDKFFNIGEVPWTNWPALEAHTSPPYDLTLKSNGCIIFIGAISPDKLVTTSKHSLGPIVNVAASHAEVGERWLLKQLRSKNKTTADLARVLWDRKWTAVAELCDDSFEEHVLPYSAEKSGLHLHGINACSGVFVTRPPSEVAAFAREWGFIETPWHSVHSISDVRGFTEEISKTGTWEGEPVEGFVVRCHVSKKSDGAATTSPPYPQGSSFFFKVKFDEPYMMYRDWREITKIMLSSKDPSTASVPKSKVNRPESKLYKDWVLREILKDRSQFEGYAKGHGIIATRERFLHWIQSEKGKSSDQDSLLTSAGTPKEKVYGKTIVLPVAIPGCGKTSIAVALQQLFGFGHTQSDDVRQKKAAPIFIQNVLKELQTHNVVIADKNNHLRQHREALREATKDMYPPVRLVALNWSLDKPPAMVHRICADRIVNRGNNHQSLRADSATKSHEETIWMFINKTEELSESEVDEVIDIGVDEDLEQMVDRAVEGCVRILGVEKPSVEKVAEALAAARAYRALANKKDEKKKSAPIRYFALLPELDLEEVIEARLNQENTFSAAKGFWDKLKGAGRITKRPHVTIVHSKNLPGDQGVWDQCEHLFLNASPPPSFQFELGNLLYNDRVMAITVERLRVAGDPGGDTNEDAQKLLDDMDDGTKGRLHITVGTENENIPPVEGKLLVENWKNDQADETSGFVRMDGLVVKGRVKGLIA